MKLYQFNTKKNNKYRNAKQSTLDGKNTQKVPINACRRKTPS